MNGRSAIAAYAGAAAQEPQYSTADDHLIPLTGRRIHASASEEPMDQMAESIDDFALYLRSERKSPGTIRSYCQGARKLHRHVVPRGAAGWEAVSRAMVRSWLESMSALSDAHVSRMYSGARSFFRFMEEEAWEGTGHRSPMAGIRCPKVEARPIDHLQPEEMRALLAACKGSRRDEAIVRLMLDTGIRRAECAGIKLGDLDLSADHPRILVHGKGSRDRYVPLGARTVLSIRRYLRERSEHPMAHLEALWLGQRGALKESAIYRVIRDRAERVGLDVHPHQLRHTFSHEFRDSGGELDDLCYLTAGRPWAWHCAMVPQPPASAPRRAPERVRWETGCDPVKVF
jgi:site-specific recombinase XerD